MIVRVEKVSRGSWLVEVTDEDKRKIRCIVKNLKSTTCLPQCGIWKDMSSEQLWEKIVQQFCVIQGTREWDELRRRDYDYGEFMDGMKLSNLVKKENRVEFLQRLFRKYRPHRWTKKIPRIIDKFLSNEEVLREGRLVLFDKLGSCGTEDDARDILIRKCYGFGMKSVSDLMIEIGMAKNLIAFDSRIVGLFRSHFDLNIEAIQSNALYRNIEKKLREVCEEIVIPLSLLDRILFRFSGKSVVEYILEIKYLKQLRRS